jgi:hypothetical protein
MNFIGNTYGEASKRLKQRPFLICARVRSRRCWSWVVGIGGGRRPVFDVRRRNEELALNWSTRGIELLHVAKSYASSVALIFSSGSDNTLVAFCSLGKEGDGRPLLESNVGMQPLDGR